MRDTFACGQFAVLLVEHTRMPTPGTDLALKECELQAPHTADISACGNQGEDGDVDWVVTVVP